MMREDSYLRHLFLIKIENNPLLSLLGLHKNDLNWAHIKENRDGILKKVSLKCLF